MVQKLFLKKMIKKLDKRIIIVHNYISSLKTWGRNGFDKVAKLICARS